MANAREMSPRTCGKGLAMLPEFRWIDRRARRRRSSREHTATGVLEDRRLLATFNPLASAADGSPNSLRAAIIQADSNNQDDTINLQTGTYKLTLANVAGQENAGATGDLDLTDAGHKITIQGAGGARHRRRSE